MLAPLAGRSSGEVAAQQEWFQMRTLGTTVLKHEVRHDPIHVARDPFQPDTDVTASTSAYADVAAAANRVPGTAPMLAPESGAVGTPIGAPGEAGGGQVKAIVSGTNPRALVESGGTTQVVGVGDALAGSRIDAIDALGVRLKNGMVLRFGRQTP